MELLDLNDDALFHILHFMDPADEFALSNTCARFMELCQLGWSSLTFYLGQETVENQRKIKLTGDEKKILEISSDKIQNIGIFLDFSEVKMFDSDMQLLEIESRKWNLKKFSFHASNIEHRYKSRFPRVRYSYNPMSSHRLSLYGNSIDILPFDSGGSTFEMLKRCLKSFRKLETLSLLTQSWIIDLVSHRNQLMYLLRVSKFCESLKSFALDCFFSRQLYYTHSPNWYEVLSTLFSEPFGEVIERFKNLQKLDINSLYLSNTLLQALSRPDRVSLQSMTVVLDRFCNQTITSWPQLLHSSPSLKVSVESFQDISFVAVNVQRLLPACVPVVSWKIYSLPHEQHFNRLCLKETFNLLCLYDQTLQSVAVQNGSRKLYRSDLLEMVTRCSNLQTLYVQGRIDSNDILKLASLQRQWLKLDVFENYINFPSSWGKNRQTKIRRFCVEVSEKLGYKWKPELDTTYTTIFNRLIQT